MAAVLGRSIQGLGGLGANRGIGEVYVEGERRGCMQSTFAAYYITTFTLNTVAIVAGILSQFDFHYSQHNNHFNRVDSWYMANGVFGVLHILAAIYIVYRIEKPLSSTKASATQQGFDYRLDNEAPPPPHSPKHIQAHEVVVVPMDRVQRASFPYSPPRLPPKVVTEPLSWPRIKHIMMEDKVVAFYILVFFIYLAWHYFMDFYHINYWYYRGMQFVMKCADTFIVAGPASFIFSAIYTLATKSD
jgi:hypothetical protein